MANPYLTGAGAMPAANPNPLAALPAAGYAMHAPQTGAHTESLATPLRQQRITMVRETKALKMTVSEVFLKYFGGLVFAAPFAYLNCIRNVPTKTTMAVFRFGKLDHVISKPGLAFVLPFGTSVSAFTGTQTHKIDELRVVDLSGNPIIVRALLEFAIEDPAALFIATNNSLDVLFNQAEQVVREACSRLPLLGEHGHDIRSQTHEIGASMVKELQQDANSFGVQVQRLCIVEARYAPEIASQMLMKQQAMATVAARKEIVAGALNVVRDTLQEYGGMSEAAKEKLIISMMITLTSHSQATPVVPIST